MSKERELDQIAVVGMAGRFPKAETLEAFWRNLRDGVECISPLSEEELRAAGVHPAFLEDPTYVRAQSMLEGFDRFDAAFFGFSPREAEVTNPQHRLFLECAWQALEDAGIDPERAGGMVGVFASASSNTYILDLFSRRDILRNVGGLRVQIANEKEFLPTWTSYKLDLRGPSVNVQTACSSSLVAVHMACQSLLNGECDLALAGGVSVRSLERRGYFYQEGSILSPDGHCRAFDAAAGGTVDGDGLGVVVLKRLVEAIEDGDNIRALILGSAVNNDGGLKIGFTAPSEEGQTRVISEALSIAGIDAETLGYVEAHGTGTRLGDPIEVAALNAALGSRTEAHGFCALGSVKTNLGHLDAAAGVAGLIKAVLALEHRELPPSLHFRALNPEIDFAASPVYVNAALQPWKAADEPRRAGVSSFGIGGTNAHVILEEAPEVESGPSREWQLLTWSAKTGTALETATENLARALSALPVADAAYTLKMGRKALEHRRALVCRDPEEAVAALESGRFVSGLSPAGSRPVAFLFPGQGAQQPGATREVYESEAVFRAEVDRCAELLRPHPGADIADLRDMLFEGEADTAQAQPALFVTGYALARLWMSWGVQPQAMLGHSLGEYIAACLSGVLRLEDALALVALRGKLMQDLPAGGMLAVPLGEAEVAALLGGGLSMAAVNGPRRTVVSGPWPAIEDLEKRLAARGIEGKRLRTSHAFHSAMMDPMLPAFAERLRTVCFGAPSIPYVSGTTGDWVTADQAADANFWLRQLREPVRFGDGAGRLLEQRDWALLEIGPGRTLSALVQQHPSWRAEHLVVSTLNRSAASENASLLEALGSLWVAGVEVDWTGFYRGERRRKVSLPTYPFERQRYFIDRPAGTGAAPWTELAARQELAGPVENATMRVEVEVERQETAARPGRHEALVHLLKEVVQDLTGMPPERLDPHATFLDIGVDSLLLIQAAQRLRDRFGVQLSVVRFLEDLPTLDSVAGYIEEQLPAERLAEILGPIAAPAPQSPEGAKEYSLGRKPQETEPTNPEPQRGDTHVAVQSVAPSGLENVSVPLPGAHAPGFNLSPLRGSNDGLAQLFSQQLQVISQVVTQQLQILQGGAAVAPVVTAPVPMAQPQPPAPAAAAPLTYTQAGPFHPIEKRSHETLSPQQRDYLDRFIRRYSERTAKSKKLTETYRPVLADGRGTVAFRRLWKEIVYPIHSQKSKGSRIWDADGNEYVDVNMGFGLHFFGHSPDFLMDALERQMRQGIEVGPQPALAGKVAGLIRELTGMDRSIVCTSGTEAIQGALRVARTVTGRGKIALFAGSYHGWSDFTFVRPPAPGRIGALPGTPGVSAKTLEEVVVLEYGSPEALEQIEALGPELAAVLIEPVRSRTPELQPREFLHDLRRVTRKTGTVLIFDEIITGFRIHPGGAQAWFGIEADLATYGKLIGGGLPIGVLSGRAAFMDTLDGGAWRFGDDSFPQVEKTLFTGTFFKHPLTLAAATAVLERLKRQGPSLQEGLNARTAQLAADLNAYLQSVAAPIEVVHFGSLFRFRPAREMQYPELFYFHLVHHGLYFTQESGNCFLTTAHTEEDIEKIQRAVRQSVEDLQEGGFLPAGRSAAQPAVAAAPEAAAPPTEAYDLPVPDNQRILWIGSRMGPNASRAYNEPLALRLRGRLHIPVLQAAVQGIADRHPALRASFPGDGMRQRIAPHVRVPLPVIDLSALGETRRAAELRWCLKALGGHEFDLEHGPLLRISLVRWDAEDHYLSLAAHHIVIDGGSAGVMVRELCLQYTAWLQGKPSPLGPAGSYADWVLRVVGRSETDPDQQSAEAYWRELFSRPVSLMQLPADRPRPRSLPFWGDRRQHRLDPRLVAGIRRLSTGERATPFATALAALGVLLHHLTGQDDIIVGIPSRDPSVTGPMVGYFINLLPVRMQWRPLEGFDTYLGRARKALLEVQEHQNYPLNRLLEKLGLAGGLDGFLIGTTFNMERIDNPPTMPGLETEYVWVYPDTARIDLHINVIEEGHTGFGLLEAAYRTSLFDPATMDRWLFAFIQVLGALAEDPRRTLESLPLLSPEQRHQLVSEWNDTRDGVLSDLRLHDLFETQAARSPAAPAVALDTAELSYGELDQLATRLAGTLVALGVGPEVRVGLCLERSFELIVALLAVLKAGGAYVPLEPTHPRERLLSLLGDSEAPLLITRRWVIDKLGSGLEDLGVRALDVDAGWPDEEGRPLLPARKAVDADNLAYVIYTSGSTGKPNGVLVSHRSAVNLVRQMGALYEAGPGTRIPLVAALTFDVSVFELFLALAFGGCLCLVREEERTNPALLAERLAGYGVTTAFFTPSMLSVLPEAPLAPVPTLGVGGEASTSELVARWSHGHRLLNCYGPTEATVFATVDAFEEEEIGLKAPPIGRPIGNLAVYVVDAWLRPVPPGVVGELAIGGAGVARGYLGRVAKTAEKFVPDPFAARHGEVGARLYRTGDLARLRPDGRIETLGRADGQVKLRGVRIELGEVESTLTAQPGVREVAVDVRGEGTAQRLAAYVVWEEGWQDRDLTGLRRRIAALLPESMVPASWIEVQALPRTANGKLDRLVLRALQDQSGEPERHEEPRTPLERFLVELWLDVLRLERLSIHDNFLELGGNSINGAMLAFHLQEVLGENMHAVVIFDAPTVAELARFLAIRYPDKVMEVWGEESLPDSVREAILEFESSLAGGVDA